MAADNLARARLGPSLRGPRRWQGQPGGPAGSGEQGTAMDPPLSGWPTRRKHSAISLTCPGKAEPVPHTDNALRMPERADQADCDSVARDLPSDRDDAGPDCHIKGARVKGEVPDDDFPGHRLSDLGIRPVEDAQYIHPAHDADQLTRIVNHRQPLYPAVMHKPGRIGQAVAWADLEDFGVPVEPADRVFVHEPVALTGPMPAGEPAASPGRNSAQGSGGTADAFRDCRAG